MTVFLFFGNDAYSLNAKVAHWKREFEKKYNGDMNINILPVSGPNAKELKAREIFEVCASMPFLAEKRLTIVKNFISEGAAEEISELARILPQIPDFCVLVFAEQGDVDKRLNIYKYLQKNKAATEFFAPFGSKLLGWIERTVAQKGGTIEKDAQLTLAEVAGGDLYRLENEIAKLVGYTGGKRPIEKRDIELLIESTEMTTIFKLTDAIGQKNKAQALEKLHMLIDSGAELPMIIYMIMRQFRIIASVKDLADNGKSAYAIGAELKEKPLTVSSAMAQTRNYSLEQIKRAYELLINTDYRLKSGGIKVFKGDQRELVLALDRLVLDLCN